MKDPREEEIERLKAEIADLKEHITLLRGWEGFGPVSTVMVPPNLKDLFLKVEKGVRSYFSDVHFDPSEGELVIHGERYLLVRSASLSFEFLQIMKEFYSNLGEDEAMRIGNNFLFDIGHVIGKKDAKAFHEKMDLVQPIEKLSAGPAHFAFTGWAHVEILPDSSPTPDEHFVLKYHHHNSFEAQSWIKAGKRSDQPVCIMNCGYSSGWCEESFSIPLTAVELSCQAKGDEHCTFVMAPPHMIGKYIGKEQEETNGDEHDVPVFFERKIVEDKLRHSLEQKETLLKEVHHRVKNNLQIISSLFRLQLNDIQDESLKDTFRTGLNRVNTMASIHELIYSDPDLSSINIAEYFRRVITDLKHVYERPGQIVEIIFDFSIEEGRFNPDKAIPLGLILNEIASNSFKYAFGECGTLKLVLTERVHDFQLIISDDGPGLPEKVDEESLGLSLIRLLSEQIDAKLVRLSAPHGLTYELCFSK